MTWIGSIWFFLCIYLIPPFGWVKDADVQAADHQAGKLDCIHKKGDECGKLFLASEYSYDEGVLPFSNDYWYSTRIPQYNVLKIDFAKTACAGFAITEDVNCSIIRATIWRGRGYYWQYQLFKYRFYEAALIPVLILVGVWRFRREERDYERAYEGQAIVIKQPVNVAAWASAAYTLVKMSILLFVVYMIYSGGEALWEKLGVMGNQAIDTIRRLSDIAGVLHKWNG